MNLQSLPSTVTSRFRPADQSAASATLPNVLYVVNLNPADKFGSFEEQIVFLHEAFRDEGRRCIPLFTFPPQPGRTEGFRSRGVEAHSIDLQRFRWDSLFAFRKLIRAHSIELVHWHFTEPVFNPYLWGLSVLCPTVRHSYTDHISRPVEPYTPPTGLKNWIKKILLSRYSQTLCVSHFVQECLTEQKAWPRAETCPHFINTDRFVPDSTVRAEMRRQHGVEGRFVVTVIAQLIPEKGIDRVLQAMTELPEKAILWIIGHGHLAEELNAQAKTLGIDHRVKFMGLQRQVQPFLQASDCFVLASRWKEAAGLVLLEAQATGVPVVASRIGGIPEYIDEGSSGFLFTPESSQELASYLMRLCNDAGLCRRMGQQARLLAVKKFSAASQLPDWLDCYRRSRFSPLAA